MAYITGISKDQVMVTTTDLLVDPKSSARLINTFVDSLDMKKLGIKEEANEGRPGYDPRALTKAYIYGYRYNIHSSRKLAEACRINAEVIWMIDFVKPDFRTINRFRKVNKKCMDKIFHEFNRRLATVIEMEAACIDGSKFQASNSKDNNFTCNKLDDRIKWLDEAAAEYMRILEENDEKDDSEDDGVDDLDIVSHELVMKKLREINKRKEKYEEYRDYMEENNLTQLSLTDVDSKLMKSKNGFIVGYNAQLVVDTGSHLILDYNLTNQVTDHGLLYPTMETIREDTCGQILEIIADKGYEKDEDIIKCLENGIIPHVILPKGKDAYDLEVPYEEADADLSSTDPEEIKKALHSGQIPEAYKDCITSIEVKEVTKTVKEETDEQPKSIYGTPEEMKARAKEGYFVRDPERNVVYCPNGEILRQKSVKANGNIRYSNKTCCESCPLRNQCNKSKNPWVEVDFSKDCLEKPCRGLLKNSSYPQTKPQKPKGKREKVKVVKITFKPSREKTDLRFRTSECPFGTIKRAMGSTYFLLRGLDRVQGEFALFCLGYNLERAKNILGFEKMMQIMMG